MSLYACVKNGFYLAYFCNYQSGLRASSTFYGFEFNAWIKWWIGVYATLFCFPPLLGPWMGKWGFCDRIGSLRTCKSYFFMLLVAFYLYKGKE